MSDLTQYFGEGGAFAEACDMYQQRYDGAVPPAVLRYADTLGNGSLAFTLGYLSAAVLSKRNMLISQAALKWLADKKITGESASYFILGFNLYAEVNPLDGAPGRLGGPYSQGSDTQT